jgi:hypothetical protein
VNAAGAGSALLGGCVAAKLVEFVIDSIAAWGYQAPESTNLRPQTSSWRGAIFCNLQNFYIYMTLE